jgi:hypothetical protein
MGAEQLIDLISPTSLTSQEGARYLLAHAETFSTSRGHVAAIAYYETYATGVYLLLTISRDGDISFCLFVSIFQNGYLLYHILSQPPRSVVSRHLFSFINFFPLINKKKYFYDK